MPCARKRWIVCSAFLTCLVCWQIFFALLAHMQFIRTHRNSAAIPNEDRQVDVSLSYPRFKNCSTPTDVLKMCVKKITGGVARTARLSSCPMEELLQNCSLFRQLHGYDEPADTEETEFPLAFGIKMHTAPEQVEQLLRTIYREHNVYCIHVDKKSNDAVYHFMTSVAACLPNVILIDRLDIVYTGYPVFQAELDLMTCALKSKVDWRYYLNLAGQDFPLRTNIEIVRILKMLHGKNDVGSFPMPKHLMWRITHQYKVINGTLTKTSNPKHPPKSTFKFKVEIRKGSQYNSFSKAFVEFLFLSPRAAEVIRYFSDTYSPDETIWATLNALPGTPGGFSGTVRHTPNNQHLSRAIAWKGSDPYVCRGTYVRGICVFSMADVPWLLRQPNLFVNKLRLDVYPQVLDCLEAALAHRNKLGTHAVDEDYINSLPYVNIKR